MSENPPQRRTAPPLDLGDLSRRSDLAGLLQLAGHLGLLALTATAIWLTRESWLLPPAMLLHGIVQIALFAPLHECVHRTAFRSRWLNDAVATAIGLVLMLPARWYRRFHFAHHRHTQDPERDPEMALPKPVTRAGYWLYLSGYYYWRDRLRGLFRFAAGHGDADFIPANERRGAAHEARWHLAVYAAAALLVLTGTSDLPLLYWALPAVLGQPFLRAYLLAEHTGCPEVPDLLANTRTTHTNAVVRRLMWNMPYHGEHHGYPAVPFHALPALHDRISDKLQVTAPGYLAFHRAYGRALAEGRGTAFARPQAS